MKARFSYALASVPLAFVAGCSAFMAAAAGIAGGLWIFVFGDDPWPASVDMWVMSAAVLAGALVFTALLSGTYWYGRRREAQGGMSRQHALIAWGVGVLLPVGVLLACIAWVRHTAGVFGAY